MQTFASLDELKEYLKAYSKGLVSRSRPARYFGDDKWWQHPTREWDETQIWQGNAQFRPGQQPSMAQGWGGTSGLYHPGPAFGMR